MEQNWTFIENFEYDYQILHKKLFGVEIFTISHKFTQISLDIGPRILNLLTLEHPFPLAGHTIHLQEMIYALEGSLRKKCPNGPAGSQSKTCNVKA